MVSTYSGNKRNKRPDFRPTGKRRLKAIQAENEKDRLARVKANELKVVCKIQRHEKLSPITAAEELERVQLHNTRTTNSYASPEMKRYRALLKLLRHIVVLEEKRENGAMLNDAQVAKLNRFDSVVVEIEELQHNLDDSSGDEDKDAKDEEGDESNKEEEE